MFNQESTVVLNSGLLFSVVGVVYVSFKEDEDGYIHLTAHPDRLALECQNKEGSSKYSCNSSSDGDSSGEELVGSPQRRSRRIGLVETVEKGPHR